MKIYGTLGPACRDADILYQMFQAGMTGVRLNLSHVTLDEAAGQISMLHEAAERAGIRTDLLIDMQGPELRIEAPERPLALVDGDTVVFSSAAGTFPAAPDVIRVPAVTLPFLIPGQQVLLDDGRILCEVTGSPALSGPGADETVLPKEHPAAAARVLRGGTLSGRKSMALPGTDIRPPAMTAADLRNIRLARQYGVTGLMQPFVRSAEDLRTVRAALDAAGASDIRLFAKIENQAGAANISELLPYADEFVIARGDLGNSMPLWELPALQKKLAAAVKKSGRDLMIVTQMLASMEHAAIPTRAEVCDIFNAVLDGADSVMVTGETAVGLYPVEVIRYLSRTAAEAVSFIKENAERKNRTSG